MEAENAETEPSKAPPSVIAIDGGSQALVARDQAELMRMINIFMQGSAFPKSLDTPAKVIAAWQVAASLKLPPMVAIQNIAVIHGSVSMWGQLPKALAESTGDLEDYRLFLIDENGKEICVKNENLKAVAWAAVCQVKRRGRSTNEYVFSMDDAAKAGLRGKSGPWTSYTKIMLMRRANATAMKFEFPDALMGVPVAEYDFHEAPDLREVRDNSRTAQANQFWNEATDGKTADAETVLENNRPEGREGIPG